MGDGGCAARICPRQSDICRLRLDLDTFVIEGPSGDATSVGDALFGRLTGDATNGKMVARASQCLVDTFVVAGEGAAASSDVICGTNSGEHRASTLTSKVILLLSGT